MGHTIDAKTITNRQIVEGLWALGVDPNQLAGIDQGGSQLDFLARLHDSGINPDQTDRARSLVAWRPDAGNVNDFIKTLQMEGVQPDQIKQIIGDAQQRAGTGLRDAGQQLDFMGLPGLKDLGAVKLNLSALSEAASAHLNPQQATQARIKTGQTQGLTQDQWNPYRDDKNSAPAGMTAPGMFTPEKIGPHPGVAAVAQTQANVAAKKAPTTPGTPGAPGGPVGGPNNTIPVDNPANWTDDKVKTWLKQNLGSDAYFVDIPEVWDVLARNVRAGKAPDLVDGEFKKTAFYNQTSSKARLWYQYERSDSASAKADIATQTQAVTKLALDQGITIDPTRAGQIAESYLRYGWSQADLTSAIGAEWHYDPSSKNQAAIVGTMKQAAKDWLVPLSDQAIQTWGQGILRGTTTNDQFTQYLRDNAKSLLPQLSDLIDQHVGDPNFTVDHFIDPYRQSAATTLGVQPDQVDFSDPKWRKALDQVDPKTGERRIMSLSEWNTTMKTDPTFGYDKTANGIQDGVNLAGQLKQSMGF